jgi:hypothetical protein
MLIENGKIVECTNAELEEFWFAHKSYEFEDFSIFRAFVKDCGTIVWE